MTYVPIAVMICHLMTAFYPPSPADRPIMFRVVAVQMDDPNLNGPVYFRRMPIDTGHGFVIYLFEGGPCAKAPGYLSSEKGI